MCGGGGQRQAEGRVLTPMHREKRRVTIVAISARSAWKSEAGGEKGGEGEERRMGKGDREGSRGREKERKGKRVWTLLCSIMPSPCLVSYLLRR